MPFAALGEVPLAMPVMGDQVTPLQTLAEHLGHSLPSTAMQLTVGMQVVTHMLPEPTRNGRLGTLRSSDPASRRFHVHLTTGRLIYLVEPFLRVARPDDLVTQVPTASHQQPDWELPPLRQLWESERF